MHNTSISLHLIEIMFRNVQLFIRVLVLLVIIDLVWLIPFANPGYQSMIQTIQRGTPMKTNIWSGIVVYLLMTTLLIQYGLPKTWNWKQPFLLGLCTYGIYDFTASTVFHQWNIPLAIMDTIWGGILFTIVAYIIHHF